MDDKFYHVYMVSGYVFGILGGRHFQKGITVYVKSETSNITQHDLINVKNLMVEHSLADIPPDQFALKAQAIIKDVFLIAASPLGYMTDAQFENFKPTEMPIPAPEIASTSELDVESSPSPVDEVVAATVEPTDNEPSVGS